jgi:hypothetical protein
LHFTVRKRNDSFAWLLENMGDAPELALPCVEARLFWAWVHNSPMPAFANNTNALYAAAWWARRQAREEAIAFAEALAKARGATASTIKRAADVAWRISDPAGFEQIKANRQRKKADEKARLKVLCAAEAMVFTVYKKARRAARAAAKAVLQQDVPKAAQQAARAQACADVAEAKFEEVFALDFPEDVLSDLSRLVRAVRDEAEEAFSVIE